MTGVSFLVPVRNAGSGLSDTIRSVLAQVERKRAFEIVIVDDGSTDGAVARVRREHPHAPIVLVAASGRGAAAALNRGLEVARYPLVAQVDQDVGLEPGWLKALLARMQTPDIAAVQAQYVTDRVAPVLSRVMGRDLQERYAALREETEHVCTGNVLYRAEAVRAVGGFDESLGYGYDNDMSYRLRAAGYRLLYCADAHSTHQWRKGLTGYARQQYGFGYGRMDLVAKHRGKMAGDSVSPLAMMLHPVFAAMAAACVVFALLTGSTAAWILLSLAAGLVALLTVERLFVGVRASIRFRDWVPLLFPAVHLLRDAAWVCAMVAWSVRRLSGAPAQPAHSMHPRQGVDGASPWTAAAGSTLTSPDRSARADSPALHAQRQSGAV